MSYKKILCPIGHEENSRAAFETAARLARESHGTLYLIHVVPLPTSIVGESVLSNDRERAHRDGHGGHRHPAVGRLCAQCRGSPRRSLLHLRRCRITLTLRSARTYILRFPNR